MLLYGWNLYDKRDREHKIGKQKFVKTHKINLVWLLSMGKYFGCYKIISSFVTHLHAIHESKLRKKQNENGFAESSKVVDS